jgi:Asp-tRNA(Asn)/Glu-tRNA(Gln) amidotransferase A subunit family amidase
MTRTVEDCAIMLGVCAGYDPCDPGSIDEPVPNYSKSLTGSIAGLRIGLVTNWYAKDAAPDVAAAVARAMETLGEQGAIVEEIFGQITTIHPEIATTDVRLACIAISARSSDMTQTHAVSWA